MATGRPAGRPRTKKDAGAKFLEISPQDWEKVPPFPEGLNEDGENLWIKIWIGAGDWLHVSDEFMITELCQIFQDKELYRRALELGEVKRVYMLSNKTLIPHPYVGMLKDARVQMNTYFSALGFSPSDRAKIAIDNLVAEDEMLEMMKAKITRKHERANAGLGDTDGK